MYNIFKKSLWVFLLLGSAILFHSTFTSKIYLFFASNPELLPFINFNELPSKDWLYNNPSNRMVLLAMMSFSALFIAPLNSFSNTIKDGNLLQVSYVKEKFNYNIIARYLFALTAGILINNFLFSILCLSFTAIDILIFYKRYTNYLFKNTHVLTNFLAKKIRQENKTRTLFFETFDEIQKIINRFEKKYPSYNQDYNNSLSFKSNLGIQELEKAKFRNFLYLTNRALNYEKKEKKKLRYFRSRVHFDFKDLQVTLSIDFFNKEQEDNTQKLNQKLEKSFVECFEYLPAEKKYSLIPYLTENLDIHFFDLYQKNEFKVLFTNVDLLREAIAIADLKVGNGIYDILYFFSKIVKNYPEMNKIVSFNTKIYNLWLVVFEKTLDLDGNVLQFSFRNLSYAIEKGFINQEYNSLITKDLTEILQRNAKVVADEFLFSFFYSMVQETLYLQSKKIDNYQLFLEMMFFFDKEFATVKNGIYFQNNLEKNASGYAKEGLLLLASYFFYQKEKKLAIQIFEYLEEDFFPVFLALIRNDERVRRWQWAQWFQEEYFQSSSLSRASLRDCLLNFVLDRIKCQENYENVTEIDYQEDDIECLQKMLQLLEQKNKKLQKVLLNTIYQILDKKQTPVNQERITEFFHCCNIGYDLVTKLSDFWKYQLQEESGKTLGYNFQMKKQLFLQKEPLKLEDYESYGEDLAGIENQALKIQLMKKLPKHNVSQQSFFQKEFIDAIGNPEIQIMFFGDVYNFTSLFIGENQENIFQKELMLSVQKKKKKNVVSEFYTTEINQNIYAVSYQLQEKNCYFLPDNEKQSLDVLLFHKKDDFQIFYHKISDTNNWTVNYSAYKLMPLKNNYNLLKNALKKEKTSISTRMNFEINIAPQLGFPQKKYLSCIYSLQ